MFVHVFVYGLYVVVYVHVFVLVYVFFFVQPSVYVFMYHVVYVFACVPVFAYFSGSDVPLRSVFVFIYIHVFKLMIPHAFLLKSC